MQSKVSGKTVDQCVNEWVDESRQAGTLVRFVGWSIKPMDFSKSKVTFEFSYEDKDGVKLADWLADVDNSRFVPKNDLAGQVYGKAE